ncbi:type II toxin-antitoxin system VapC family toxin [Brevundimonas sp.]|uniref:type II toxin-antitoxin system VapC family toxin n=1 Tax=Brevundimonas sp. TaxID=1871086 RepID=UPI002ABBC051|nr:PIN domain-containing protein [Brevundimonas sp.]MDZ4363370.1 PIN domain-containing protein [Brevundimonas sp.]
MIHLDTQVVVWLAAKRQNQLSRKALKEIERSNDLRISPIVLVEIEVLIEIRRIKAHSALGLLDVLADDLDVKLSSASLESVARMACSFAWTRDPSDRLIVANAMADNARLVTADETIRANFKDAVW